MVKTLIQGCTILKAVRVQLLCELSLHSQLRSNAEALPTALVPNKFLIGALVEIHQRNTEYNI